MKPIFPVQAVTPMNKHGHSLVLDGAGNLFRLHFENGKSVWTSAHGDQKDRSVSCGNATPAPVIAIGDRVVILNEPLYVDSLYFNRVGNVIDIDPSGDIGVRLDPLPNENSAELAKRRFLFKPEAVSLLDNEKTQPKAADGH
jgi:hypothetical protein